MVHPVSELEKTDISTALTTEFDLKRACFAILYDILVNNIVSWDHRFRSSEF
jgi:hypothetical protein